MATPARALAIQPVIVTISLGPAGKPQCSPDPFVVSKLQGPNMVVDWICEGDKLFSVDFGTKGNSPFYECHFTESEACSGLVRRDVLSDKQKIYKYTVRVGGQESDPGGRVDP